MEFHSILIKIQQILYTNQRNQNYFWYFVEDKKLLTRKYTLRRYIQGALMHTTAWDWHWGDEKKLMWGLIYLRGHPERISSFFALFRPTYSSLSNNCADGINVQDGKFSKIDNCADFNKCAGWKILYSY